MRRYAPLFNSYTETWMVIFQDAYEAEWYVEIPNAGGESSAVATAHALNTVSS